MQNYYFFLQIQKLTSIKTANQLPKIHHQSNHVNGNITTGNDFKSYLAPAATAGRYATTNKSKFNNAITTKTDDFIKITQKKKGKPTHIPRVSPTPPSLFSAMYMFNA